MKDKCLYNLSGSWESDLLNFHNIGLDFGYSTMDKKNIPSSIYEHRYIDSIRIGCVITAACGLNFK